MWTSRQVVIVGGCGHVGLPLGLLFASRGVKVTLLDIDAAKVEKVNRGEMPFMEQGAAELLRQVVGNGLEATLDASCLNAADAAVAVVGTPVDRYLNPTLRNLCRSVDDLLNQLPDGALLVLRSTVYPGVTKIVYDRVRALGREVHVAFCPERITEGNALAEMARLPQIVAAFEPEALARARGLFSLIAPDLIELPPAEAELASSSPTVGVTSILPFPTSSTSSPTLTGWISIEFMTPSLAITRAWPAFRGQVSRPVRACSRTHYSLPRLPGTASSWGMPRC